MRYEYESSDTGGPSLTNLRRMISDPASARQTCVEIMFVATASVQSSYVVSGFSRTLEFLHIESWDREG